MEELAEDWLEVKLTLFKVGSENNRLCTFPTDWPPLVWPHLSSSLGPPQSLPLPPHARGSGSIPDCLRFMIGKIGGAKPGVYHRTASILGHLKDRYLAIIFCHHHFLKEKAFNIKKRVKV